QDNRARLALPRIAAGYPRRVGEKGPPPRSIHLGPQVCYHAGSMTRRAFLPAAASAVAAGNAAAAHGAQNVILELRRIQLRNGPDNQRQRNNDFLKQQVAALGRAGAGPTAVFSSTIASDGPFLLVLASYPGLSAMEQVQAKLASDAEYQKALDAYNAQPGLDYERMETSLLRA